MMKYEVYETPKAEIVDLGEEMIRTADLFSYSSNYASGAKEMTTDIDTFTFDS